jgi:hypothetical protein
MTCVYVLVMMFSRHLKKRGSTQAMYGSLLDGTSKGGGKLMKIIYAV